MTTRYTFSGFLVGVRAAGDISDGDRRFGSGLALTLGGADTPGRHTLFVGVGADAIERALPLVGREFPGSVSLETEGGGNPLPAPDVDHSTLLAKYIRLVYGEGGTPSEGMVPVGERCSVENPPEGFSDAEWAELQRLAQGG